MQETFLLAQPGARWLLLLRHGQQRHPTSPVFDPCEWYDPPLSDVGEQQAAAIGRLLAEEPVDVVACSGLSRASQTAQAVAGHHGLEPVVVPELREVDPYRDVPNGAPPDAGRSPAFWQGMQARWPHERRWALSPVGETGAELRERVVSSIEGLLALHPGKHVAVVSHGGVINAYLAHLLGIEADMVFLPAHTSVTRLRVLGDRRVLHSANERHHLDEAGGLLTY